MSKSEKKLVGIARDYGICKIAKYKWRSYRFFSRCHCQGGKVVGSLPSCGLPSVETGRDRVHQLELEERERERRMKFEF